MIFTINSPKYGIKEVRIDDEDWLVVSQYRWYVNYSKCTKTFYVRRNIYANGKQTVMRLHRMLLLAKKGEIVDHKNNDTLDNRKSNLRLCTYSENKMNSTIHKESKTSKYKGVGFHKDRQKYQAYIRVNGKQFYLGLYESEIDAAKAYDKKAIELFGDFKKLNIPEKDGAE